MPPVFLTLPTNTDIIQGSNFTYYPGSDQEGLDDWRDLPKHPHTRAPGAGPVLVTDSSGHVLHFNDLQIDPHEGTLTWTTPPVGVLDVYVTVDDSNGGRATQVFQLVTMPVPHPLDSGPATESTGPTPGDLGPNSGDNISISVIVAHLGDEGPNGHSKVLVEETVTLTETGPSDHKVGPVEIPEFVRFQSFLEKIVERGDDHFRDILDELERRDIDQPALRIGGTIDRITELTLFETPVDHGIRLAYTAEDVDLWHLLHREDGHTGIEQPSLDIGGSIGPETPLEGYIPYVEAGRRLNFDFFPVREVVIRMDDIRIGELLGL